MRFLHTSDWHLGASDGDRSLLEDQLFFIEELCRIAGEEHVGAVLVTGDVFDRSVASADAVSLYDAAMTRLCSGLGIPVLVIAGNHDSAERLSVCGRLLEGAGLYVCGAAQRAPRVVSIDDTDFYLLPWITEAKIKSLYPEKSGDICDLSSAYAAVTEEMRSRFVPGRRHVLLAHAFVTDSETSTSDRAAEIGFASQIPASVFDGFNYAALGHLHKPQSVTESIRYSGTPMPYSFGKEEEQVKSVTVVDTADMSQRQIPLRLLHERRTLEGSFEELLRPECDESVKNGYVRLRVTDRYVGLEAVAQLREVYPNYIEIIGQSFGSEGSSVTMTRDELEAMESEPAEVFRYFCREELECEVDERRLRMFEEAVKTVMEGEA